MKRQQQPPADVAERTLPHSLEAERAILGAILLHPEAYDRAADVVEGSDFYRDAHRRIFEAMGRLVDARHPVELLTLLEELGRKGEVDEVGGPAYITALVDGVPRSSNVEHYAGIVRDKRLLRETIRTANSLLAKAYDAEQRPTEIAADGAERLYALGGTLAADGQAVLLKSLVEPSLQTIERLYAVSQTAGTVSGVATGFVKLDEMTSGLQPSDLVLIAARTSMGKTALAMNIARNAGGEVPTLVFSLEMSKEQLFLRLLSSEARIDSHRLRTGRLEDSDWTSLGNAMGTLSEARILIDDQGGIGVREVRARARQVKAKYGLGLIVIDYLQLMTGRGMFDNRTQELGTISRGLKAVAKELAVPVVALCQLSRNAEPGPGRKPRRPELSDLAESGSLENDADVVLMIYRPEPKDDEAEIAEVIIRKQRNGPTGIVKLHWNDRFVRFENISVV